MSDKEQVARAAIKAFVCRSLVLLAWTPAQGVRSEDHGSGCFIRDGHGAVWVLTANHLFDCGAENVAVITDDGFYADAISEVVGAPNRLDVALARVREDYHATFLPYCLTLEIVESLERKEFSLARRTFVAAGFPEQFRFDRQGRLGVEDRFVNMVRFSDDVGVDNRKFSIAWSKAKIKLPTAPFLQTLAALTHCHPWIHSPSSATPSSSSDAHLRLNVPTNGRVSIRRKRPQHECRWRVRLSRGWSATWTQLRCAATAKQALSVGSQQLVRPFAPRPATPNQSIPVRRARAW